MGLNERDKTYLHRLIDYEIEKGIGELKEEFLDNQIKAELQIENPHDFVYGVVYGWILCNFKLGYAHADNAGDQRSMTQDEYDDFLDIFIHRMKHIRDKVFDQNNRDSQDGYDLNQGSN